MRPITTILCLAAAVLAATARSAQADEIDADRLFHDLDADADGQLAPEEVGEAHRLLFKRLVRTGDEDGDGRLSAEEFASALQPVRAEKNFVEKMGSRLPGADALTVALVKMDANGDRQLDADEIPNDYQRLFEQMLRPADGNKDGRLNQREIAQAAPRLTMLAQIALGRLGLDVSAELEKLPAEKRMAMDQMDAYGRPGEMMADPAQAEEMFKRLDANGDKQLVADEAPPVLADRFAEMLQRGDRDGDGALSKKEFTEMSRRAAQFEAAKADPTTIRRVRRQLMERFDRDDDGRLTVREAPTRLAENFDRADADGNGSLDDAELTQVAENMARMQKFAGDRGMMRRPAKGSNERTDPPAKK